jgi:fumarate hydratase class II
LHINSAILVESLIIVYFFILHFVLEQRNKAVCHFIKIGKTYSRKANPQPNTLQSAHTGFKKKRVYLVP